MRWLAGRERWCWLAAAIVLLALGGGVWGTLERWEPEPGGPLPEAGLDPPQGWRLQRNGGNVVLSSGELVIRRATTDATTAASRMLDLGFGARAFQVDARIALTDVEAADGAPPWATASVGLMGRGVDGRYDIDRQIYLLSTRGSAAPRDYSARFELAGDAVRALLFARLRQVRGTLEMTALRVTPLRERLGYVLASGLLGAGWTLFLACAGARLVATAATLWAGLATLALTAAGLAAGLWPHATMSPLHRLAGVVTRDPEIDFSQLDRGLHFCGFMLLALALRYARPADRRWTQGLSLLAVGIGSELIQGYVGDLGLDDLIDAGVNATGVIAGLVLASRLQRGKSFTRD